jgi:hypothetical protein
MKNKPILKEKRYAHFDKKIKVDNILEYVKSHEKVSRHGFMPLIHFTRKDVKYTKEDERKAKLRDLYYVSHRDAFIYQWYSKLLNDKYNERVAVDGTNKAIIAYRNNRPGKFNAHFAKEVFDFIKKTGSCYIIVGDFTSFFDNLEHLYLKKMLCELLNVEMLSEDYWAVIKSVMRYSWFELDDLLKLNKLKSQREINALETVLSIEIFRESKRKHLRKNKNDYGIPQGTPISALLSNVYMLSFDKQLNNTVTSAKGLYRRYSDDFIVVLPSSADIKDLWCKIDGLIKSIPRLELQNRKTKVFSFGNKRIRNCNSYLFPKSSDTKDELEYLGFSFNGETISIRPKTISKFYYRAYHRVDGIRLRTEGIIDKRPDYYSLYKNYTHLGKSTKGKNRGNFLTYIDRCVDVFGEDERVHIVRDRHWDKIQNRLNTPLQLKKEDVSIKSAGP